MYFTAFSGVLAAMRLPDPVAFSLGNFSIYWTGIFLALGILAAIFVTSFEAKRLSLAADTAVDLCLVLIPSGIIGARVLYVLSHLSQYAGDAGAFFRVWDGGLSLFGAILFGVLGLLLYALKKQISFLQLLDVLAPGLALAQALAVWGDFFNQQNFGRELTNPALFWFPLAVRIERTDTIHYATFFFVFLLCICIFLLLLRIRKRARHSGTTFFWYLLLLCAGTALIGCLGGTAGAVLGPLSATQLVCIPLALISAAALYMLAKLPAAHPAGEAVSEEASGADDCADADADLDIDAENAAPTIVCECCIATEVEDAAAANLPDPADAPEHTDTEVEECGETTAACANRRIEGDNQ